MASFDKEQFRWAGRGIIAGAIVAIAYDLAQFGLIQYIEPPTWEIAFLVKALAFAVAIFTGMGYWLLLGKSLGK